MSSSTPEQYDPPNKLIDLFGYTASLHPIIHSFYTNYANGPYQQQDIVGVPVLFIVDRIHGTRVRSVGHSPIHINVGANMRPRSNAWEDRQYPNAHTLAIFHFDSSNCGMSHFHCVNNLGQKGLGTAVLALIELIAVHSRRKYITCSISDTQEAHGSKAWLEKNHYVEKDSFVGANSGHRCFLYVKDLLANPTHQTVWKPKKEPTK